MLDGLEAVELKLSDISEDNNSFRFDSEYFRKEYLLKLDVIKKVGYKTINDFAFVTDGIHESIDFCEKSKINLLSAKSPKENIFDLSGNDFISESQHIKNKRTELQIDDVIVSTVGTIGNCAVVDSSILPANSDRHVGIIRIEKDFLPHFLSTFLLSKYGKVQTLRESTGNVQLNLFIYKIKSLKIPFLSTNFQKRVEALVKSAHTKLEESKKLYREAEELLLEELRLKDFEPSRDSVAVRSFANSFGASGRLDAEYYQPKYDDIINKIRSKNTITTLENSLRKLDTGEYSVEYLNKADGLKFYIRSTNMKNGLIEIDDGYFVEPVKFTKFVSTGDIVTARVGTLGVFATVDDRLDGSIFSDNVMRLRLPDNFNPYVYTLYFNTSFNKELIDRLSRGSVQERLNQETLKELEIPMLDEGVQKTIATKINESFKLRSESKSLLDLAKKAVEDAIEKGEENA